MSENIEEIMNSIINFCNRTSYYILIFFINIGTMLNSIGISIKSFIISDSLDDLIYNLQRGEILRPDYSIDEVKGLLEQTPTTTVGNELELDESEE